MTELDNHPRTVKQYLRLFFTGAAMGAADPVPGVSGGTMAFILGVYEDLLKAIKSFSLDLIKLVVQFKVKEAMEHVPWQFLLALGLGIGTSVLLMANIIGWLMDTQRVYLFAFFFGLILASIIAIGARVTWSLLTGGMLLLGTAAAYAIVNLIPLDMPHDPLTIFLSSAVAIVAMILPGISGSFILLILGQYEFVINAIKDLDIISLLPVFLGCIVGLLGFSRLLSWLLARYEQPTIALLVGFMAGSLVKIWPWKEVLETRIDRHGDVVPLVEINILPDFATPEFWLALALCLFGFVLVTVMDHLQFRSNPVFTLLGRRKIATVEH